jgi:hypothetical protein
MAGDYSYRITNGFVDRRRADEELPAKLSFPIFLSLDGRG